MFSKIHTVPGKKLTAFATLLFAAMSLTATVAAKPRPKPAKHQEKNVRQSSAKSRHNQKREQTSRRELTSSSKRGRKAEIRRAEARRRAEAARLAAAARQRALEEAMRERVQALIAKDDLAGEDIEVRRIAVNALGNHAGTVVVMDPKTGRVLAMVNQQWAMREGFKPCSTIKLVTGVAGLNEGIIDSNTADANRVNLTKALAFSKNDYFQQVGGRVGFGKMISYARELGLGEKTGLNMRNESAGRVPLFKSGYAVNHMSSHGDDFKVTAVQLATLVSAMANGGKLLTPFVQHSSQNSGTKIRRSINFEPEIWRSMVPGMVGAVNYGSGRKAYDPVETVAGKTGTCIEHGSWVGLFASYAPLKNPRYAIVVIARGSDGRNHFPAAVAGRIYRELSGGSEMARRKANEGRETELKATDTATDVESAGDDDEADQSDTSELKTAASEKTSSGNSQNDSQTKVKPILMAYPAKNPQTLTRERRVKSGSQ